MFFKSLLSIIAIVSMATSGAALAQGKPISLNSKVMLERTSTLDASDGVVAPVKLVEAEGVVPGDTLVFSTAYRNGGSDPVLDVVIVNPVPANVRLSEKSASTSEVSIDGGNSWGMLSALSLADTDGNERRAGAADVTHLRWTISRLAPNETGVATYRATVR